MKCVTFLIFTAVVHLIAGMWLVISPDTYLKIYGVIIYEGGMQFGALFGASLLALGAIYGLAGRYESHIIPAEVLWGGAFHNLILLFLAVSFTFTGQWNAWGWAPVAWHAVMALAFGVYAQTRKPE
jgi:hypothetical protein